MVTWPAGGHDEKLAVYVGAMVPGPSELAPESKSTRTSGVLAVNFFAAAATLGAFVNRSAGAGWAFAPAPVPANPSPA